ncbi:MFS transporter [Streptomyces roseirectus]|uniref:MFS transporter n=1 Tax=Streptomyces roseirectus TaxID=2768066 RepID=A0A7H0IHY4_9ACTN|nr:MFS transporter [Streptomyces roseirectus]QNP72400.1 MFS transporter [Streptomyces roseirectus]
MPHAHHGTPPETLYTTTGDSLIAVDLSPRTSPNPNPYRHLLALPGARAFTAGNLVARLPSGMFGVSAVMMIAGQRGSYALAGAVTATGLAATAVVAPHIARLVDRRGQVQVAVPAALFAALGAITLVLCVRHDAPTWTLFAAYAATATAPNTGGMSRARWAHLLAGDEKALHTANSFEQAADELCFLLGPLLAALLCANAFPEAGTLVAAALLVTGILLFAAQRATEPPPHRRPSATSPLTAPGMPPLLAVCLCLGAVFGATEVTTVAFADEAGHKALAGLVLGLQAAGSAVAGLVFGAKNTPRNATTPAAPATTPAKDPANSTPHPRRYPLCIAAMTTLLTLPLLTTTLTNSLPLLALSLLLAGAATAPTMITGMTLIQQHTPEGRLNEGMTLAVTALLAGIAAGSASGGWTAEHVSPTAGYVIPVTAAGTALLVSLLRHTRHP